MTSATSNGDGGATMTTAAELDNGGDLEKVWTFVAEELRPIINPVSTANPMGNQSTIPQYPSLATFFRCHGSRPDQ